jgi:hypothetical protein
MVGCNVTTFAFRGPAVLCQLGSTHEADYNLAGSTGKHPLPPIPTTRNYSHNSLSCCSLLLLLLCLCCTGCWWCRDGLVRSPAALGRCVSWSEVSSRGGVGCGGPSHPQTGARAAAVEEELRGLKEEVLCTILYLMQLLHSDGGIHARCQQQCCYLGLGWWCLLVGAVRERCRRQGVCCLDVLLTCCFASQLFAVPGAALH